MCYHDVEWVNERVGMVARLLGGVAQPVPGSPIDGLAHRYRLEVNGRLIFTDFVVWHSLVAPHKRELCFDSRAGFPGVREICGDAEGATLATSIRRARVNDQLKSVLMNSCLADAIIYAGARGSDIRAAIRALVTRLLVDQPPFPEQRGLVFVSESLGSKVLFDALLAGSGDPRTGPAMNRALQATRQLFMVANQVPTLDLAEAAPVSSARAAPSARTTALRALVEEIRPRTAPRAVPPRPDVHVIAFTDPNDLLSYRLPLEYFGREDVHVTNVLVSNAGAIFGLFEWPVSAHTGYRDNESVLRVIVCGRRVEPDRCGK
jgi:hypothetical protein